MTTLTIEIPENVESSLSDIIEKLGGKIISNTQVESLSKSQKKEEVLSDLQKSVEFVKRYKEKKIHTQSIAQLLDEL